MPATKRSPRKSAPGHVLLLLDVLQDAVQLVETVVVDNEFAGAFRV